MTETQHALSDKSLKQARSLFERLATASQFEDFLTLPAYEILA
jgi:hypothetical protein